MVLEYHRLGDGEGAWYRSAPNFRADLERLYAEGYRPITVADMVDGNISLAIGTTPVVFTFDDSSLGQFYFLEDGSIDPNTFVGIWDSFRKENPDWSGGATWCVLPAADYPSNFFGEKPSREVDRAEREGRIHRKVDFLIENGHEICNHTLFHARLDRADSDDKVREWIGRGADSIRVYLPEGYPLRTLALPLGMWPANHDLASNGDYHGHPYHHDAILEVAGGPDVSPFDRSFDPLSINRVVVTPGALKRELDRYAASPSIRYIADGVDSRITVPAARAGDLDEARWRDRQIVIIDGEDDVVSHAGESQRSGE